MKTNKSWSREAIALGFAASLFLLTSTRATAQQNIDQVIQQFYPATLQKPIPQYPGFPYQSHYCYAIYDRDTQGNARTVIAGYGDGFEGTVRILQLQPAGNYAVIADLQELTTAGGPCTINLQDVDGDGHNEIMFSPTVGVRSQENNVILKWDGYQLTSMNPYSGQGHFLNASFLDQYHDGTLQVLSVDLSPSLPDKPEHLYRLSNGQYALDSIALFSFDFHRGTRAPYADVRVVDPPPTSTGPYVLKITNGDRGGANRVTSGHILVNGTQIFGPSDFGQQVEFLSVPLTNIQPGDNTLSVELEGKPGSHLIVLIQDQTPALQNGQ